MRGATAGCQIRKAMAVVDGENHAAWHMGSMGCETIGGNGVREKCHVWCETIGGNGVRDKRDKQGVRLRKGVRLKRGVRLAWRWWSGEGAESKTMASKWRGRPAARALSIICRSRITPPFEKQCGISSGGERSGDVSSRCAAVRLCSEAGERFAERARGGAPAGLVVRAQSIRADEAACASISASTASAVDWRAVKCRGKNVSSMDTVAVRARQLWAR